MQEWRNTMESIEQISTGLSGADEVIGGLRPGDHIIWQVDTQTGCRGPQAHPLYTLWQSRAPGG